jgi:hypothetical protein
MGDLFALGPRPLRDVQAEIEEEVSRSAPANRNTV